MPYYRRKYRVNVRTGKTRRVSSKRTYTPSKRTYRPSRKLPALEPGPYARYG